MEARRKVREGISPAIEKQRDKARIKAAKTFGDFGRKWLEEARMAETTRGHAPLDLRARRRAGVQEPAAERDRAGRCQGPMPDGEGPGLHVANQTAMRSQTEPPPVGELPPSRQIFARAVDRRVGQERRCVGRGVLGLREGQSPERRTNSTIPRVSASPGSASTINISVSRAPSASGGRIGTEVRQRQVSKRRRLRSGESGRDDAVTHQRRRIGREADHQRGERERDSLKSMDRDPRRRRVRA